MTTLIYDKTRPVVLFINTACDLSIMCARICMAMATMGGWILRLNCEDFIHGSHSVNFLGRGLENQ
jgi:hypothetical protein